MRILLIFACLLLAAGGLFAQSKQADKSQAAPAASDQGGQVEVNKDRFSGDVTIKLKPQMVYEKPDQFITLAIETKLSGKRPSPDDAVGAVTQMFEEHAIIRFDSQAKIVTDFGDEELHFITDGKHINIGKCSGGVVVSHGPDRDLQPGYKVHDAYTSALDTDQLKQIANGTRVEMRLGKYEITLTPTTLRSLREFAIEYSKHSLSSQLKGKR
jgi:hypothetical protein